jgi:hypothetical protein
VPGFAVNVSPTFTVPEIVGNGGVANVPAATEAVATLVREVSTKPAFTPVTVTLTNFPWSSARRTYVDAVAPSIGVYGPVALEEIDQTQPKSLLDTRGLHVPGTPVNVLPTFRVPMIVGTGAVVNSAAATDAEDALVRVVDAYPDLTAVTTTDICAPKSDAVKV